MKISVITPALNPRADFLERVFAALEAQTLPKSEWEYIMVDSGSSPKLSERCDLSWHPASRIVEEPYQVLAKSRLRGMREAVAPILVFVDDDNVLAPDYLESVDRIMRNAPFLGALGSYCHAEFEGTVEPWMTEFLPILGAAQYAKPQKYQFEYARTTEGGRWLPAGSGLVLRRAVVDAYQRRIENDPSLLLMGRVKQSLSGSEDTDLVFTAMDAGFAVGKSLELNVVHLIPKHRLQADYLQKLLYASNYSSERLAIRWGWRKQEVYASGTWWSQMRQWVGKSKKKSPQQLCWVAANKGRVDGRTGQPFDARYLHG